MLEHHVLTYVPGNRTAWLGVLAAEPDKKALRGATVKSWVSERKKRFLAEKGLGDLSDKPAWLKPGFPLHYNSDLLEALYALALCDTKTDPRLARPLELLRGKMTAEGKVVLETTLNGKTRADVERVGRPSKWLTYRAWYVLRHFRAA